MANLGDFDASAIEPSAPRDIIPPGEYPAVITASDFKDTRAGTGKYLSLEWVIVDGEYAQRHLWSNLNLINPNAQAVEIAERDLSAICRAVGKMRVTDSSELHDIPILLVVKVRPAGRDKMGIDREAQNEIAGYKPLGEVVPITSAMPASRPAHAAARAAPAAAPAAPAAKATTPPWRK